MLLLEEGLSYGIFTEANGSKPIIVHPDGTLCINYLDTNGAPLSNLHIDMACFTCLQARRHDFRIRRNRSSKGASPHLYPATVRRLFCTMVHRSQERIARAYTAHYSCAPLQAISAQ